MSEARQAPTRASGFRRTPASGLVGSALEFHTLQSVYHVRSAIRMSDVERATGRL